MKERDLYEPIKQFLTTLGYTVRGEVDGCDLVAMRGDDMLVVEMKRTMNLTLILQGVDRQSVTENVYVAIPAPRNKRRARWHHIVRLCRLLGLGLMTVSPRRVNPVDVICDPGPFSPRRSSCRAANLKQEFQTRSGDFNVGGSSQTAVITAYREEALRIADFLRDHGPASIAAIKAVLGSSPLTHKTGPILQRNYYGWFERVARGVYQLTPLGLQALDEYKDVVKAFQRPDPIDRPSP